MPEEKKVKPDVPVEKRGDQYPPAGIKSLDDLDPTTGAVDVDANVQAVRQAMRDLRKNMLGADEKKYWHIIRLVPKSGSDRVTSASCGCGCS
jgi:hypothetical protein